MKKGKERKQESDSEEELDAEAHKKGLENLKNVDPDFFKYLEMNDDKLLDFNVDDDDESDNARDEDEDVHIPGPLRGDSDESDFEDETKPGTNKVTLQMISEWQEALQSEGKIKLVTITTAIKAFNAAMLRATADEKDAAEFKVEGSSVFNSVIQMCVLYLPTAIKKYLGMESSGKDPRKCKHFVKIKNPLIAYINDMLKLLGSVASTNILTVLLKHLHQMSCYIGCFGRLSRLSLKKLITLWSTGEETVRVLAFLCILRITRNQQSTLLNLVLKNMYITYVKNCKFVSPSTWPGINFMRRSLVEMFSLDINTSYNHAFLYIRQLAIHLRNAIVVQKIENRQAVYNWQFINSLHLWADFLGAMSHKPQLQQLIYPLVMVITNTIKLVPTHQYYPLRFHCVEILIHLSKEADTFIPILPFLVEVLTTYDFNKKNKKTSMKPLDFSCILRLAKSQLMENGFKDQTIERVYALTLEYMSNQSHSIAFPDLCIIAVSHIKQFLKKCSMPNYTKKIRQLVEKIEENSKFIEKERAKVSFNLTETKVINAWETSIKNKGTPLSTFYENWSKINKIQKRKSVTKNDELAEELPMIKRPKQTDTKVKEVKPEGPLVLFPSDSEDENNFGFDDIEEEKSTEKPKKVKKTKKVKKSKKVPVDISDDAIKEEADTVQDLDVKDW